jgi:hypothetical protein
VMHAVTILPGDMGCDFDGDGMPDNAFGNAFNTAARDYVSGALTRDMQQVDWVVSLFVFESADATVGSPFRMYSLLGVDTDTPPVQNDYFSGHEPFFVRHDTLDGNLRPLSFVTGSAPGGVLATDEGTLHLVIPFSGLQSGYVYDDARRVRFSGNVSDMMLTLRLCAAYSASSLHATPNQTSLGTSMTILDGLVVGLNSLGFQVTPTQPDFDADGDGLERLMDIDNDGNIDLCIDGNGTQLAGHDCPFDPRIADGYTEALDFDAISATLAGSP